MYKNISKIDFKNQAFHIGLDVHKKSWNVTIRTSGLVLKTFSMNPSPAELWKYMERNYPGGLYYSCYEAGFSGYWAHRELERYGFKNIIVTPSEIPTTGKERSDKNDVRDSRKIARELEKGTLEPIYVPSVLQQELRSFNRLRSQLVRKQTRTKNQIKSYLNFYGHTLPEDCELKHWSRRFIEHLRELKFDFEPGKEQLNIYLEELIDIRKKIHSVLVSLRRYCQTYNIKPTILLLMSIPGIGFISALTIYTEFMDVNRFSSFDQLASYVGLIPATSSTGEKEKVLGMRKRHNTFLRPLLIEAAWVAAMKDPALTLCYNKLSQRMKKQEAIIRIAKKLLSRINYVLKNNKPYVKAVVK